MVGRRMINTPSVPPQALGQSSRLAIFRLLLRHEPDINLAMKRDRRAAQGAPEHHLGTSSPVLSQVAESCAEHETQPIWWPHPRADLEGVYWLVSYLLADCCGGDPAKCEIVETLLHEVYNAAAASLPHRSRTKT